MRTTAALGEPASVSTFGLARAGFGALRVLLLVGSLFTLVVARSGIPAPALAAVAGVSLGGLWLVESRRGSPLGAWATYVLGFVVFAQLRTLADDVGVPAQVSYVVEADEALFAGALPTSWLQERLHGTTALDFYCAGIYVSYFVVPHAVALALWRRSRAAFRRFAVAVLGALYLGLAICFLVPTGPPWLAADLGAGVEASRILAAVLHWQPETSAGAGMNPVAAMPSLHMALTALVAFAAWRYRPVRLPAVVYATSMAFALVYTGEHYVVDVLAGMLVAAVAWRTARLMG